MLNQLKYYLSKDDYFRYFSLFIFIFIVLNHTSIFNSDNLIPLFFSIAIVYYLIHNFILDKQKKFNIINSEIYSKFDYSKYPFLNTDNKLLISLGHLEILYDHNKIQYRKLLADCNDFFKYYSESKKKSNRVRLYDLTYYTSKEIINNINSYGTSIDVENKAIISTINLHLDNIKQTLSKYLQILKNDNNLDWLNKNIDINSRFISNPDVDPYEVYIDNYNVY